jgi:trigger factor
MEFTYLGLKAKLDRHAVTEEEVNHQLERLRQQTPRIAVITDRATQRGDEVVLDYAGFCQGEQFAGGTAEKQTLVLGSGTFIPGFEEQLLDKVVGEKVTVSVTFPEQYHSEDLAGKAAEFRCVIHEIRVKTAYDLDDTFAKEVGGCDTLEQMREKLAGSLQAYTDERGEMELQDNLLRQAAATLDMEVSEAQIEAALDEHMNTLKAQLAQQGLSIEMYCQFMGTDEKQLRSDARAEARQSVRVQAAIEEIIKLEQLTATEEEKGEAIALIARQNRMTVEQLKPYFSPEFEAAVVRSVLTSKVMGLIRQNANIEE